MSGLIALIGCGAGKGAAPAARPGVPPPSDEQGFRAQLSREVTNGGLWFADAGCREQFGHAGTIAPAAFDAFAKCVAGLHLRPTGRADAHDDTSVLTDDAGFEIEAHVAGGRLDFIGFSGRAPGAPDLPSITPEALEALRISGDREATISKDDAAMLGPNKPSGAHTEHLRLCVAADGQLAVTPATTSTPASVAAFTAVTRAWAFRPFAVAGTPIAACAIVGFQYPAAPRDVARDQLPRPPRRSKAGNLVYDVPPAVLEKLRTAGTKLIVPDDEDKIGLNGKRLLGSFKVCLDETGRYESGEMLQSTGVARYDAKIVREMMAWAYRPYVVEGVPVPVCSAVTFIYTQR